MKHCTPEGLIAFSDRIRALFAEGDLPFVIHLGGGNEKELIEIFDGAPVKSDDWVFSGHRSHYHYLLKGGTPDGLAQKILDGESMYVFDKDLNFLSSSVLGGTCGIAAGIALGIKMNGGKNHVWCFLGDGAEEGGHFYEAAIYVEGQGLPCTFIVEDNNKSVDTNIPDRRGPNWKDPWKEFKCIKRYHYVHSRPHCGPGLETIVKFKNIKPRW